MSARLDPIALDRLTAQEQRQTDLTSPYGDDEPSQWKSVAGARNVFGPGSGGASVGLDRSAHSTFGNPKLDVGRVEANVTSDLQEGDAAFVDKPTHEALADRHAYCDGTDVQQWVCTRLIHAPVRGRFGRDSGRSEHTSAGSNVTPTPEHSVSCPSADAVQGCCEDHLPSRLVLRRRPHRCIERVQMELTADDMIGSAESSSHAGASAYRSDARTPTDALDERGPRLAFRWLRLSDPADARRARHSAVDFRSRPCVPGRSRRSMSIRGAVPFERMPLQ